MRGQDVAIAYGYNNIAQSEPRIWGAGSELPLSQLSEALRLEAAMAGSTEVPHSRAKQANLKERRCSISACNTAFAIAVLAMWGVHEARTCSTILAVLVRWRMSLWRPGRPMSARRTGCRC